MADDGAPQAWSHPVHDERRDEEADQGGRERGGEPGDPRRRNGHAQLGRQLHAQQVLRGRGEEQGAGVHAALELRLHQELAQAPRARRVCALACEVSCDSDLKSTETLPRRSVSPGYARLLRARRVRALTLLYPQSRGATGFYAHQTLSRKDAGMALSCGGASSQTFNLLRRTPGYTRLSKHHTHVK